MNTTPRNRFEVDLTSVCVRRGAVQLPYRLKDAFSDGPVAAVDADGGAALELGFRPPRELTGLHAFFEAHALRANDRIALLFDPDGLRVEAIKRERPSGAPSQRAERARPAPPIEGSPGGAPGASKPVSSPTAGDDSAPRSAASPTPPSLRLEVPTASVPASGDAPSADVRDTRPLRWEPLDVLAAEQPAEASGPGGAAEENGERASGSVVVREVRRASRPPAESQPGAEQAADVAEAPAADPQPSLWSHQAPSGEGQADDGDDAAGGSGLFGLGRRFGFGRGSGRGGGRGGAKDRGDAGRGHRGGRERAPAPAAPDTGWSDEADPWLVPFDDVASSPRDGVGPMARGDGGAEGARPAEARASTHGDAVTAVEDQAWEPDAASRDMAAVHGYLAGPEVPAIVRTERVAEALGISVARAERALDRVSEGSEHLSRIRPGAYMLRRPSQG